MRIETERLIIRQWEQKDRKDLYEYASDPSVTKFLCFPTYASIADADERISTLIEKYKENPICVDYCIECKECKKAIGGIGIVHHKESNEGEAEIGYVLNPKFNGKGFMTEALLGFFSYIKNNEIAKRIYLRCDVENIKSANVMVRAGMKFEGILRKAGHNNYHSRHDVAQYSILYEEINI